LNASTENKVDSGLWSILSIAALHGIPADPAKLIHEFGTPFDQERLLLAANFLNISAKSISQDIARLNKAPLPAVAQTIEGTFLLLLNSLRVRRQPNPSTPA